MKSSHARRRTLVRLVSLASVAAVAVFASSDADAARKAKAPRVPEVVLAHAHVTVGDLVPGASPEAAIVDLGPAPSVGGSRIVDHDEIALALSSRKIDERAEIPLAVRITRKADHLDSAALDQIVRHALDAKMPKGTQLTGIRLTRPLEIPSGWTRVTAELPRPPRKVGPVSSATTLSFFEGDEPTAVAMASVGVELSLSEEALVPDVPRGTHLTLVVRRGLVEVSTSGSANIDGDIGDAVPVLLKTSGRIVQARIEDKEHAIALDTN